MPTTEKPHLHATDHNLPSSWPMAVLDNLRQGVLVERGGHVVYANRAYAALLGFADRTQLIGMRVRQLIAPEDRTRLLGFSERRMHGDAAPFQYWFNACRTDGSVIRIFASISVVGAGADTLITTMVKPVRADESHAEPKHLGALSERERQVIRMLLAGKRPKEIAFELQISQKTVATHRRRLYDKLGFQNSQDLFRFGVQHDLVEWS